MRKRFISVKELASRHHQTSEKSLVIRTVEQEYDVRKEWVAIPNRSQNIASLKYTESIFFLILINIRRCGS